ncbi:MAG: hypothetical protein HY902_02915, partial [Deltaproteobacteria bacterium]|nr:hypothetical protein [Deltaproteobacteria bacterium]
MSPLRSPSWSLVRRGLLAVVCLAALGGAAGPAWAEQTVLKLTLDLDCTSDWLRVELRGLRWRVLSR